MKLVNRILFKGLFLSFFGGVLLFVFQTLPNSLVFEHDPRLDEGFLSSIGFQVSNPQQASLLPMTDPLKSVIEAPVIYLGFEQPGPEWQRGTLFQYHYQVIAPFHRFIPPIQVDADGSLNLPRKYHFYTSDQLYFSKLNSVNSNLSFLEDHEDVYEKLKSEENAIGIVHADKVSPKFQTLTNSFPLRLWLGWKENKNSLLQKLGINIQLYNHVEELMGKVDRENPPQFITIKAVGDMMLGRRIRLFCK